MSDKDKTQQETTAVAKSKGNVKIIAGVVVLAIILLQAFWNMADSKIAESVTTVTKEMESLRSEVKAGLSALETRVAEAEKGALDIEAVKADVESANKAAESFEDKLSALIQAEEMKLAALEKDAADQKAYIDGLKNLLGGLAE